MVRARCAPQFLRVLQEKAPTSPILRGGTSGCIAGEAYMRIDPTGRVTPCPYIPPTRDTPRLGEKSLREIWETDPAFISIRECAPESACAQCSYSELCKGCRARALALDGDAKGPDPSCVYDKRDNAVIQDRTTEPTAPLWTKEARERLERVPRFLRPMVSRGVERYARHMRIREITPEIMARLRSRARKD
jgi:radical SAM protein with 4Fe4S-binding SPASM domain